MNPTLLSWDHLSCVLAVHCAYSSPLLQRAVLPPRYASPSCLRQRIVQVYPVIHAQELLLPCYIARQCLSRKRQLDKPSIASSRLCQKRPPNPTASACPGKVIDTRHPSSGFCFTFYVIDLVWSSL